MSLRYIQTEDSIVANLSKTLNTEDDLSQNILMSIKDHQGKVMIIRQNIIDKQRVVSNMLKRNEL